MIKDIGRRAGKTFVQGAIGSAIIETIALLNNWMTIGFDGVDWANWKVWLFPILCGALSAGLSAIWNNLINVKNKDIDVTK